MQSSRPKKLANTFSFTPPFSRIKSRWDAFWDAFAGVVRSKNKNNIHWQSAPRNKPLFFSVELNLTQFKAYLAWGKKKPSVAKPTKLAIADPEEERLKKIVYELSPSSMRFCELYNINKKLYNTMYMSLIQGMLIKKNSDLDSLRRLIEHKDGNILLTLDDVEVTAEGPESPIILAFIKLLLEKNILDIETRKEFMEEARVQKKWQVLALLSAHEASQKFNKPFDECIIGLGVCVKDTTLLEYRLEQALKQAIEKGEWEIAELIKAYSAEKEKYFGLAEKQYLAIEAEYKLLTPSQKYDLLYDLALNQPGASPENLARIEILLKQGTDRFGIAWSMAYNAAYRNEHEKWNILDLFASFHTDEYDRFGYGGALLLAAEKGQSKIAKKLSNAGANVHCSWEGRNGLAWALQKDDIDLFEHLLVNHYANATSSMFRDLDYFLWQETSYKKLKFVAVLAKHFPMPEGDPCNYGSALLTAAFYDDRERWNILIAAGANNSTRRDANCALHYAVKGGHVQLFKDLLEKGLNPLARDRYNDGLTAIDMIANKCKELSKKIKASTGSEKTKLKNLRLQWREVFQALAPQVQAQLESELRFYQNQSWFSSKHRERANDLGQDVTSAVKESLTEEQPENTSERGPQSRPTEVDAPETPSSLFIDPDEQESGVPLTPIAITPDEKETQKAKSPSETGEEEKQPANAPSAAPPANQPKSSVKKILTILADAEQPLDDSNNRTTNRARADSERKVSSDSSLSLEGPAPLKSKRTPRYTQALHNTTEDDYQVIVKKYHRYFKTLNRDLIKEKADLKTEPTPKLTFGFGSP